MAEEETWQYNPDGSDDVAGPGANASSTKKSRAKAKAFSWEASEYIDHKQGMGWFVALAAITIVLAGLTYLITKDYFATAIILMMGLAVGVFAKRTPRRLAYELSDSGLSIGDKKYPYATFKAFAIVQDGPLLSLDLEPTKRFMPTLSVYFEPADHEKIMQILEDHLPYQEKQLDFTDRLSRRLRF